MPWGSALSAASWKSNGKDTKNAVEQSHHEIMLEGDDVKFLEDLYAQLHSGSDRDSKDLNTLFRDIDRALAMLLGSFAMAPVSSDIGVESRSEVLRSYKKSNHWQLCAVPGFVELSNRMLLRTLLGDMLEKRGALGFVFSLLALFYGCLGLFAPAVNKYRESDSGWIIERCNYFVYGIHIIVPLLCAFLVAHRVNVQLLRVSFMYFETVSISGCMTLACVVWLSHCRVNLGDAYTAPLFLQDCALMVTKAPLLAFFSAPDCLSFRRKWKLLAMFIVFVFSIASWWHSRCVDNSWGVQPKCVWSAESDGINAQHLYLAAHCQKIVFFSKGLIRMLFGNSFAVLRPRFFLYREKTQTDESVRKREWRRVSVFQSASQLSLGSYGTEDHQTKNRLPNGNATKGDKGDNAHSHISVTFDISEICTLQSLESVTSSDVSVDQLAQQLEEVSQELTPLLHHILGVASACRFSESHSDCDDLANCADVGRTTTVLTTVKLPSRSGPQLRQRIGCEPSILEVNRRPLVSTWIGRKLAKWRVMDIGPPAVAIIMLLSTFAPKIEIQAQTVTRKTWTWKVFLLNSICMALLVFLLVHRINRFLFFKVVRSFDAFVIACSSIATSCLLISHWWNVFRETYLYWFLAWNAVGLLFEVMCLSNIDSWRARERTRLIIYCFAVASYLRIAYRERCENSDFLQLPRCSFDGFPGGKDLRNLYLNFWETAATVFSKLLFSFLCGDTFAVYQPCYVPANKLKDGKKNAVFNEGLASTSRIVEDSRKLTESNSDETLQFTDGGTQVEAVMEEEAEEKTIESINLAQVTELMASCDSDCSTGIPSHLNCTLTSRLDIGRGMFAQSIEPYNSVHSAPGDQDYPVPMSDAELFDNSLQSDLANTDDLSCARFSL